MTDRRTVTLRQPKRKAAELVVTEDGAVQVFALTFDQLMLLNRQTADAILVWHQAKKD